MKFKGVLFDLDGTLVDSLEDLADSMNRVLRGHGYPAHAVPDYKAFIGNGIRNLVRAALPESGRDEQTVAACHAKMIEIYGVNCLNKTRPYDGIAGLLDALKSRGMQIGVLSNKADELARRIVQSLLPGIFDSVMGLRSGTPPKPDPSGALLISAELGIRPEALILTGDMRIDMQTARNAGMSGAGALWGFGIREDLLANGADCLLDHPRDLIDILDTV